MKGQFHQNISLILFMYYWASKNLSEGGSRLEDIIVERGQPNDDKKKTKGGRGVKNGQNLVDVIYGCPLTQQSNIFIPSGFSF